MEFHQKQNYRFIFSILDDLTYLNKKSEKKCFKLKLALNNQCCIIGISNKVIQLCNTIKKNCIVFEDNLRKFVNELNPEISNNVVNSSTKRLRLSLHCKDNLIIEDEEIDIEASKNFHEIWQWLLTYLEYKDVQSSTDEEILQEKLVEREPDLKKSEIIEGSSSEDVNLEKHVLEGVTLNVEKTNLKDVVEDEITLDVKKTDSQDVLEDQVAFNVEKTNLKDVVEDEIALDVEKTDSQDVVKDKVALDVEKVSLKGVVEDEIALDVEKTDCQDVVEGELALDVEKTFRTNEVAMNVEEAILKDIVEDELALDAQKTGLEEVVEDKVAVAIEKTNLLGALGLKKHESESKNTNYDVHKIGKNENVIENGMDDKCSNNPSIACSEKDADDAMEKLENGFKDYCTNNLIDLCTEEEADDALKMLDNVDSDSSLNPTSSYASDYFDESDVETNGNNTALFNQAKFQEYNLKECYVNLEGLQIDQPNSDPEVENMHVSFNRNTENEIDRLCDITTLKKRKKLGVDSRNKVRRKRKRIQQLSGSETTSLSGYTSIEDDDNGIVDSTNFPSTSFYCPDALTDEINASIDPNELLAEIICHTVRDSSYSDSDVIEETQHIKKSKERANTGISPQRKKKKMWRRDQLLTEQIISSDSEQDEIERKCASRRKKDNFKSRQIVLSSNSSSSSSDFDVRLVPFQDHIDLDKYSDSDNKEENDCCIINIDTDEEQEQKKGRRNIRPVLEYSDLTEATQQAEVEEERRISRLEKKSKLSQNTNRNRFVLDSSTDGYKVMVDIRLSERMFPHQREGVRFMWDACYESVERLKKDDGSGCVLAHCMGLGKTFQVISLIHTLFYHRFTNTRHVLIVCPLSTVAGWENEFKIGLKHVKNIARFEIIAIGGATDSFSKYDIVATWRKYNGVLIMGYECFEKMVNNTRHPADVMKCTLEALVNPGPDLVVCDEGHLLRNGKSLRTQALMTVKTKRRIVLTGTPLQNNLKEYYHMVQFVKPYLLGNYKEYTNRFVNPIMNGQYEDSSELDINLMKKRTHVLHSFLKNTIQRFEGTELKKYLENMKDYAIFIQLDQIQETLYKHYIELTTANKTYKKGFRKGFFNDYQVAKYICSHPLLLYTMEKQSDQSSKKQIKELDTISQEPEAEVAEGIPKGWWKPLCPIDVTTNIEYGTKLKVMLSIIEEAEKIGDKVLIFTSSLVELNSIEYFLKLIGTPSCTSWTTKKDYFRMDGTVSPSKRSVMCDLFNDMSNKKLRVFLMSHKVGGLGLNLTSANRVILLGANFNPSYDTQSIYRVYRFGQHKTVYVYRLISMGTMEEKVYQRCVTKLAVASRVVDKHQIDRHYTNLDLQGMYSININLADKRPSPQRPDDDLLSKVLLDLECIYKYHEHQSLLENRPNEELNETDKQKAWEEFKKHCKNRNTLTPKE